MKHTKKKKNIHTRKLEKKEKHEADVHPSLNAMSRYWNEGKTAFSYLRGEKLYQ